MSRCWLKNLPEHWMMHIDDDLYLMELAVFKLCYSAAFDSDRYFDWFENNLFSECRKSLIPNKKVGE